MLLNYVSSLSSNKKEFESICKEKLCGSNPLDYLSVSTFQTELATIQWYFPSRALFRVLLYLRQKSRNTGIVMANFCLICQMTIWEPKYVDRSIPVKTNFYQVLVLGLACPRANKQTEPAVLSPWCCFPHCPKKHSFSRSRHRTMRSGPCWTRIFGILGSWDISTFQNPFGPLLGLFSGAFSMPLNWRLVKHTQGAPPSTTVIRGGGGNENFK